MRCKGRFDGNTHCKNNASIRIADLERIVIDELNSKHDEYFNLEMLEDMNSNKCKNDNEYAIKIKALEKEKENMESSIKKKSMYYKKLYEDKVDGLISELEFKTLNEDFRNEMSALNDRVEIINKDLSSLTNKMKCIKDKQILFEKYRHIEKLDRMIIEDFIDKIYIGKINKVTNERPITIEWNF